MSCAKVQGALSTAMADASRKASELLGHRGGQDGQKVWLLGAAIFCAFAPLEVSQLVSLVIGVLAYLLLQALQPPPLARTSSKTLTAVAPPSRAQRPCRVTPWRSAAGGPSGSAAPRPPPRTRSEPRVQAPRAPVAEVRTPSAMPVAAPTFQAVEWDAEVQELIPQLAPTAEGRAAVSEIARSVERAVRNILPDASAAGYLHGSIQSGTAFGVAVPEVDIVISIAAGALQRQLPGHWGRAHAASKADEWKLQKAAVRACTESLVGTGAFKFRRSAFRDLEPKVTIIAPASIMPGTPSGVPINLFVNAVVPLQYATVLERCGDFDARAKELVLLVKRWAKDRGLCHTARGVLAPYAWSLLAIYFAQVGLGGEALVPPMSRLVAAPGLASEEVGGAAGSPSTKTTGELFREFAAFYAGFDWRGESVSVRLGKRAPPEPQLPTHSILSDDGSSEAGPSIEDPFRPSLNLGSCMTASGFAHVRRELARAQSLSSSGASLSVLLEPWSPPDAESTEQPKESCRADGSD